MPDFHFSNSISFLPSALILPFFINVVLTLYIKCLQHDFNSLNLEFGALSVTEIYLHNSKCILHNLIIPDHTRPHLWMIISTKTCECSINSIRSGIANPSNSFGKWHRNFAIHLIGNVTHLPHGSHQFIFVGLNKHHTPTTWKLYFNTLVKPTDAYFMGWIFIQQSENNILIIKPL